MAAIYSNGGNRWNILGFNFTKRDALSSVYQISMAGRLLVHACRMSVSYPPTHPQQETWSWRNMVGGIWREGGGGVKQLPVVFSLRIYIDMMLAAAAFFKSRTLFRTLYMRTTVVLSCFHGNFFTDDGVKLKLTYFACSLAVTYSAIHALFGLS